MTDKLLDCAIIGGGPAGLNAALVLGRARRDVALFDEGKPRNAVTRHSHGFITRDGITPGEFRAIAHADIAQYDSVQVHRVRVTAIRAEGSTFRVETASGEVVQTRKVLLATGLKDVLPAVDGIRDYYGKSLFSCPYCDGWELRDRALVVISETDSAAFHMAKTVYRWSQDLVLCTNGASVLTAEEKERLTAKGIVVDERKIVSLVGEDGFLEKIVFEDGEQLERNGGFVAGTWEHASTFGHSLGCEANEAGGLRTDDVGRTTVQGVYAAGDASVIAPAQLVIAAADGSRTAIAINSDLTHEDF
ncbi:NAD(P)/FAD-dependent oxidoreductase [Cohnella faecalis]|uniref:NAD(P)/FAD-dependent oxidoreductase n=1 Tax=Cohnella faecalis TaxID=2315694 RepID=A0A398CGI6_9BACL|nr:NAD(P)/FAD-dependent oxidoreductase [Cohnella faecalis]RIE01853.1 NAD(P)/FAD-dependent oxidoreductase [Cohnella faecalis]